MSEPQTEPQDARHKLVGALEEFDRAFSPAARKMPPQTQSLAKELAAYISGDDVPTPDEIAQFQDALAGDSNAIARIRQIYADTTNPECLADADILEIYDVKSQTVLELIRIVAARETKIDAENGVTAGFI